MIIIPIEKKLNWKKPPFVLFTLICLNILIFLLYQTGDHKKYSHVIEEYESAKLLELEKPAYNAYVNQNSNADIFTQLHNTNSNDKHLNPEVFLFDLNFDQFLEQNKDTYITADQQESWAKKRQSVNELRNKISHIAYGLTPEKPSIITLLSHQFLHGGVMHLVGNMVFLFLFGFAVEGALGHLRFFVFYIISGICAGLLYTGYAKFTGGNTLISLVGASGSISGVMAMYIGLYRLKKIEFFYWLLFFVGYFRAPALLILPVYIGHEIFQLLTNEHSNVAYTAHIGGFIGGALLLFATQLLSKKSIDEDYLDNTVKHTPLAIGLDKIYSDIAAFKLRRAYDATNRLINKVGATPELEDVRFKLLKGISPSGYKKYVLQSLNSAGNSDDLLRSQIDVVKQLTDKEKSQLSFYEWANLTLSAVTTDNLQAAIKLFEKSQGFLEAPVADTLDIQDARMRLALVSRRLADYCRELNRDKLAETYTKLSAAYLKPAS